MQRFVKNEATLGYKMPKMHQAPAARCACRKTMQATQVLYSAISVRKRCQSTSPHRGICGCPGGQASGKVRPRESVGSYVVLFTLLMHIQSNNQSIRQSGQSINQSINQSIQPIHQSNQSIQSNNQSISQPINHSFKHSINQSIKQSIS